MKNSILAFLLISTFAAQAQKEVREEIKYQDQSVEMSFDLATTIEVRTWEKSSILVEASLKTDDPLIENFRIDVKESSSIIEIASNSMEIFDVDEHDGVVINRHHNHEFNYVVYVPKGIDLKMSSITGDFSSASLDGNISIDLVTGNIDIKEFKGDLELNTVTGRINLPVKNSSFEAATVMGEIYANAYPNLVREKRLMGQEMKLDVTESPNRLSLKTVTGNIYLQ